MIEIQYRGGVQRVLWNSPFCQWQTLNKLLKMLGKLKSVYYHTTRFYNKAVTVTSLYWQPGWKLCHAALIAISAFKSNYRCFVLWTNTDDVRGFLQVQHYWGVNICCKVLNLHLWKLWTRNWSHHVPTTKSTPFVVSKDEWDTKEGTGKSMNMYSSMVEGASWAEATSNSEKYQVHSLSHC